MRKALANVFKPALKGGQRAWKTTHASNPKPWSHFGKTAGWRVLQLVNLACLAHLFTEYVGNVSHMSGISMLPTLASSGELVIENILTYRLFPNDLKRGDLITLKSPLDPYRIICKRILGLPGDTVCVDPTGISAPSTEHVIVPKGHVWIIGDNAAYSRDSRTYGPVSMSLIRGKLYARIWPLKDFTVFRNPTTFID